MAKLSWMAKLFLGDLKRTPRVVRQAREAHKILDHLRRTEDRYETMSTVSASPILIFIAKSSRICARQPYALVSIADGQLITILLSFKLVV